MDLKALIVALRPHQWVKNVFVFAALVFARGERGLLFQGDSAEVRRTLWAFAAFCLGASTIYLINDIVDRESDRRHPTKSKRPIASGRVSVPTAIGMSIGCAALAMVCALRADGSPIPVWPIVLAYMVMNGAYSLRLKHVVLVDAFCIAAGFLLRVIAGALAVPAEISHWLLLCTMFLALFLALSKRKAEMDLLGDDRGEHRAILREYNSSFLDQMTTVLASCAIVTYTMYTVAEETVAKFGGDELVYTVPFVVFGLGRYLFLVHTQRGGGNPTKILLGGDLLFAINTLGWIATVAWVISKG